MNARRGQFSRRNFPAKPSPNSLPIRNSFFEGESVNPFPMLLLSAAVETPAAISGTSNHPTADARMAGVRAPGELTT